MTTTDGLEFIFPKQAEEYCRKLEDENSNLRAQRDKLLAALGEVLAYADAGINRPSSETLSRAYEALAEAKEGK